jgi:hypothetical protein
MEWLALLPVVVSAAVILLLYTIPPPWVKRYMGAVEQLKEIGSPQNLGNAIHHAACKNEYEVMNVAADYADDAVQKAIPKLTASMAEEALHTLGAMYEKGYASKMGDKSGATRGYLSLPGFQKHAAKAGLEGLAGGALGNFLPPEIAGMITPEMINGFMSSLLTPAGNGGVNQGAPGASPQAATNSEWRPPV